MYNLGEQFKMNTNSTANEECTFKGEKYRITVLTERLLRLEYNKDSIFENRATELVFNRNLKTPTFDKMEDAKLLTIVTPYLKLTYVKEQPFQGTRFSPQSNLKVEILASKNPEEPNDYWYYGMPEIRNYGAPDIELLENNKVKLKKSLYSLEGFTTIDDSKSKVFEEDGTIRDRDTKGIDIYLFVYINDFTKCLEDYYAITGYTPLIPRYALGNWWSRNQNYSSETLKKLVDKFGEEDIPISVLMLDHEWHVKDKNLKSGFSFDKTLFENPEETIKYLHDKKIRMGLTIDPSRGITNIDDYYNEAIKYLETDQNGNIPFDVLNPKYIDVYLKFFIHQLDNMGVDFYFLDFKDKNRLEEMNIIKHYHFYDMLRTYNHRPLLYSYNTGMVAHKYSILYSGKNIVSWDTLKTMPYINNNAANIGVSWWSHDIGGYYKGIEDNELYTRFVQLGTFSPIMKFGSEKGKYYKREPWKWDLKTYDITKRYLKLRHNLVPYIYTEGYKLSKYGFPLIRPLYYKHQEMYDDPIYRNEYYFGTELFIAPIVTSKDYVMDRVIHKFFIPEGIWYDFITGKKFPGNRKYVSFFKDQDYPVFARMGSIIPLGINDEINDLSSPKNMEIHIFPGKSNTYKLYEDDGYSNMYLKNDYLISSIDYNYMPNNYTVIIRPLEGQGNSIPLERNYKFRFRNTKKAEDVTVYQDYETKEYTSYIEGPDFIVEVNDVSTTGHQLTVNCKGKDIEIDAVRIINEDIEGILSDLQIETEKKEQIDAILFSDLPIKKKRIQIRKLGNKGLAKKFVQLFLKLLEYIDQV